MQLGGSDQWGNIAAGIDYIRRKQMSFVNEDDKKPVYGLTTPLLVDSKGNKFGKSVGGALWLNPDMTSPYELYQFLLNVSDFDVQGLLEKLTFLPLETIESVMSEHQQSLEKRHAQMVLADELTNLIHGEKLFKEAKDKTQ